MGSQDFPSLPALVAALIASAHVGIKISKQRIEAIADDRIERLTRKACVFV